MGPGINKSFCNTTSGHNSNKVKGSFRPPTSFSSLLCQAEEQVCSPFILSRISVTTILLKGFFFFYTTTSYYYCPSLIKLYFFFRYYPLSTKSIRSSSTVVLFLAFFLYLEVFQHFFCPYSCIKNSTHFLQVLT